MKLEIKVSLKNEDGAEVITPVTVDTNVPDFDDFHDSSDFLQVFDVYEKSALKIRNESVAAAKCPCIPAVKQVIGQQTSHLFFRWSAQYPK